jgi:hypothetical protein
LAARISGDHELPQVQFPALVLAEKGYDVDAALMRRLGLSAANARRELGQLLDLGLLLPRKARDDGSYPLASGLRETSAAPERPSGNGVRRHILDVRTETATASHEEPQQATGANRSGVTKALDEPIANVLIEVTGPPRTLSRRYWRKR